MLTRWLMKKVIFCRKAMIGCDISLDTTIDGKKLKISNADIKIITRNLIGLTARKS